MKIYSISVDEGLMERFRKKVYEEAVRTGNPPSVSQKIAQLMQKYLRDANVQEDVDYTKFKLGKYGKEVVFNVEKCPRCGSNGRVEDLGLFTSYIHQIKGGKIVECIIPKKEGIS